MQNDPIFGNLFLSAGAMKAGTTWLYGLLRLHPELHVTPEKELHYFHHRYVDAGQITDAWRREAVLARILPRLEPHKPEIDLPHIRRIIDWVGRYLADPVDDRWFCNLFPSTPGYICDFSNLHAHLPPRAWVRIAAQSRRLRVLYILRDPVDRAWSHVKFHLKYTGQLDQLDRWGTKELSAFARQPFIRTNGDYGKVLRTMQAGLEPGQLKVMIFEDIHADPLAALREVERFLGVSPFDYPANLLTRKVNVSPDHTMPEGFAEVVARDVDRVIRDLRHLQVPVPKTWHGA